MFCFRELMFHMCSGAHRRGFPAPCVTQAAAAIASLFDVFIYFEHVFIFLFLFYFFSSVQLIVP